MLSIHKNDIHLNYYCKVVSEIILNSVKYQALGDLFKVSVSQSSLEVPCSFGHNSMNSHK